MDCNGRPDSMSAADSVGRQFGLKRERNSKGSPCFCHVAAAIIFQRRSNADNQAIDSSSQQQQQQLRENQFHLTVLVRLAFAVCHFADEQGQTKKKTKMNERPKPRKINVDPFLCVWYCVRALAHSNSSACNFIGKFHLFSCLSGALRCK